MHASDLPALASFRSLHSHFEQAKEWQMQELFAKDPDRFARLSLEAAGLLLDYSKNRLTATTMQLLCALARERNVEAQRDAMFAGARINGTENRAALHVALRAPRSANLKAEGRNVSQDVHAVLDQMQSFVTTVRERQWLGYTGKPVTDIVNIGIGGSYLGPKMVCQALRPFADPHLSMHFASNVDGHDISALLQKLNPETTLFIIASKTFTTMETMMNARTARTWFLRHGSEPDLAKHFVAVSTNTREVQAFGIDPQNMFPFWDWVGGRYSVWSAIGLPIALSIGFDNFRKFLDGAHAMDQHFQAAPLEQNMPVVLALVGVWNRNFFDFKSISIAPYHQDLCHFPGYLQQLEMESNGKQVATDGRPLQHASCPVVWGDVGTNGQHAYFQLLHQGSDIVPVDFIAALKPSHDMTNHHMALLANCFAQAEALMRGKNAAEIRNEAQAQGMPASEIERLLPHKVFPGNRPSNTILMETLTPAALGSLIALYEHKTFVQGILWGINSFDQWGVELGKILAKNIQSELENQPRPELHDSSTNGLIARTRRAWQSC